MAACTREELRYPNLLADVGGKGICTGTRVPEQHLLFLAVLDLMHGRLRRGEQRPIVAEVIYAAEQAKLLRHWWVCEIGILLQCACFFATICAPFFNQQCMLDGPGPVCSLL